MGATNTGETMGNPARTILGVVSASLLVLALVAIIIGSKNTPPKSSDTLQTQLSSRVCAADDNKDDCETLAKFFPDVKIPGYDSVPGFADGTPLCKWYGITCKRGRVTEIDFNGADSYGCPIPEGVYGVQTTSRIPDSIGKMTSLTSISINQIDLAGTIPSSIGSLSGLKYLSVGYSGLSGTIPSSLGKLHKLEVFDFSSNSPGLTGMVPASFANLKNLQTLSIDDNKLTGFHDSLCNLMSGYPANGKVTYCKLTSNPFTQPCPPCAAAKCQMSEDCPSDTPQETYFGPGSKGYKQISSP